MLDSDAMASPYILTGTAKWVASLSVACSVNLPILFGRNIVSILTY